MQGQAREVMTLSEVEPRVQERGKQYEGAKGSLQGAVTAVVSELLSKDKYTHTGDCHSTLQGTVAAVIPTLNSKDWNMIAGVDPRRDDYASQQKQTDFVPYQPSLHS